MKIKRGYIFTLVMTMLVGYMVLSTVLSVRSAELTSNHISEKIKSQNMNVVASLLSNDYVGSIVNQSFFYAVAKLNDHTMIHPISNYSKEDISKIKETNQKITEEELDNMRVLSEIKHVFLYGNTTYDDEGNARVYDDSLYNIKDTLNASLKDMGLKLVKFIPSNVQVGLESGRAVNYSLSLDIYVTDQSGRMSLTRTYNFEGDVDFTGMVDPAIAREFKKMYEDKCNGDTNAPQDETGTETEVKSACDYFEGTNGYLEKVYLFKNKRGISSAPRPSVALKNVEKKTEFSGLTGDAWWYGPIVVYGSNEYYTLTGGSSNLGGYTLFIDVSSTKPKSEIKTIDLNDHKFGHVVGFITDAKGAYSEGNHRNLVNAPNNYLTITTSRNKFDAQQDGADPIASYYFNKLKNCGGAYGDMGAKCALVTNTTMYNVEDMRDWMVCQDYVKDDNGPSILQRMMVDSYNKTSKDHGLASIIIGDFIGGAHDDMRAKLTPVLKDKSSRVDVDLFNPDSSPQLGTIEIMGMAGMKNDIMASEDISSVGHFHISGDTANQFGWGNLIYEDYKKQ